MGAREGESLSRQATTPLKPGGVTTSGLGSGDPGDDVKSDFSCMTHMHSLACWCWLLLLPALQPWHCQLNSLRVGGVHPVGDHWLGGMQYLHPARKVVPWNFPLFSLLVPHRGNIWLLSWLADHGHQSGWFLRVSSVGVTSSVDTSAGVSSLVGSFISCGVGDS